MFSQSEIGLGFHFSPPAKITYSSNAFVKIKPLITPAFSLSYRKTWKTARQKEWYWEAGVSTFGLNYNVQNYFNDTMTVWGEFNTGDIGYPTILFEVGRKFKEFGKNKKSQVGAGIESGLVVIQTLDGLISKNFGIIFYNSKAPSPLFLRLGADYSYKFKIFKKIPARLQLYTKITPQLVTSGSQYIRDKVTGVVKDDGTYKLNASEIGIKLYTNIKKEHFDFDKDSRGKKNSAGRQGPSKYRFSLEGQYFIPPATEYFIPRVDSFSLSGSKFSTTNQIGAKMEILSAKKEGLATIFGIGFGKTTTTTRFSAISSFTTDGNIVDTQNGSYMGLYLMPNLGFSVRHRARKSTFSHTFSATCVIPITNGNENIIVLEKAYYLVPPHLVPNTIFEGTVSPNFGNVYFGAEYQPEILFRLDKKVFYGLGMVFNYTRGVVGHGLAKVTNGNTTYFGGITQGFSKIGLSFRVGLNAYDPNL